jgi:hypothetical protein
MTLVAAYERLIGARGTEIKDSDPTPAIVGVPPVIMSAADRQSVVQTHASANVSDKPQKAKEKPRKKRKHVRKRHKRGSD